MRALRLRRGRRDNSDPEAPDPRAGMLASAPVPLDWERFADRRPRRLKRGKHFVGEPKILQREAQHAAKAMGKVALVSKDQQGKYGYLWIQFVDAAVDEGEPCPVCNSYELLKLTNDVIRCPSCDSMLEFNARPLEMPALPVMALRGAPSQDGESSTDDGSVTLPRDPSELAKTVSTRALHADGTVAETFSADEPLMIETLIRSHLPGLRANLLIAASVESQRAFVSRQPHWAELDDPGLYAIRAHFPVRFLMNRDYRFKVAVKIDDGSGSEPATLTREEKWIALKPADGISVLEQGVVRPALEWTSEPVDPEDRDPDSDSIEDAL